MQKEGYYGIFSIKIIRGWMDLPFASAGFFHPFQFLSVDLWNESKSVQNSHVFGKMGICGDFELCKDYSGSSVFERS